MPPKEQLFRIFKCPHCGYTGYRQVTNQEDESICNLCSKTITNTPDMIYVMSADEARKTIQKSFFRSEDRKRPQSRYGLGVKRRLLNIVADLSDLNRGRGVSRRRVLEECQDADIDLEKAKQYLSQLEEEGRIYVVDDMLSVIQEDAFW